jgi:hypothetical protein
MCPPVVERGFHHGRAQIRNTELIKLSLAIGLLLAGMLVGLMPACSTNQVPAPAATLVPAALPTGTGVQTFVGFITSEDDFVDPQIGADPSKDTRGMILMEAMARSGLGIAIDYQGGWQFYYLSGDFATTIRPAFNGTGAQLDAWNIVLNTKKKDHISAVVTGLLDGTRATNPGGDADGIYYPVIRVDTIVENLG